MSPSQGGEHVLPKARLGERARMRNSEPTLLALKPERPPEFHCDEICLGHQAEVGAGQETLPAAIPDNEQIISWLYGPAQASIGSDVLRIGVVLDKAGQDEV